MNNVSTDSRISTGTRLGSMLMDHFFMTMIAMIFAIPGMISTFANAFEVTHEQESLDLMGGPFFYINLFGFALYLCKDCINGQSLAKRLLTLQVVDNETGLPASPIKCFIRNITLVLWPIEAVVALSNTSRRLGDRIAGTKLVVYDKAAEQPKVNFGKVLVPVLISYGSILLLTLPFISLISATETQKINYVETSYNEQLSKETEKLFSDSLGQYLTASVKAYDRVEDKPLKYASVIFELNENYLESDQSYEKIKSMTMPVLTSKLPDKIFIGQVKYMYRTSNSIQTRIEHLSGPQKN